jgi:type VI secretion system secreted protein VgrG
MISMQEAVFHFTLVGFPEDALHVARFDGKERINELFEFTIVLASLHADLDLERALYAKARLCIRENGEDIVFQGIAASMENLHASGRFTFYQVKMVPSAHRLALTSNNRVFLNKQLPEVVREVLGEVELAEGVDYKIQFKRRRRPHDFLCQYQETNCNFLKRRLENEAAFFFFESGDDREQMILADGHVFKDCAANPATFHEGAGLHHESDASVVHELFRRFCPRPAKVTVRDFNELNPLHDITAEKATPLRLKKVHMGETHLYATNAKTQEQCNALANLVAKRYACEAEGYKGAGRSAHFRPGRIIELRGHPQSEFNGRRLLTSVAHHGRQERHLSRVLGLHLASNGHEDSEPSYFNEFWAIPEDVSYVPARKTPRPDIHGALNAFIDAEGSGEYAEMDEHGRYKVVLPFDVSGRKDGKASAWIRMLQPYGGEGHGLHLPLHKGCEVALMFVDGDPDQPIIAGALPNMNNSSPVTDQDAAANVLSTAHGNSLSMGDARGRQHVLLCNKDSSSFIRLGAGVDEDDGSVSPQQLVKVASSSNGADPSKEGGGKSTEDEGEKKKKDAIDKVMDGVMGWVGQTSMIDWKKKAGKHGAQFKTPKGISLTAGASYSVFMGESFEATVGAVFSNILGSPTFIPAPVEGLAEGLGYVGTVPWNYKDPSLLPLILQGLAPAKGALNMAIEISAAILPVVEIVKAKKQVDLISSIFKGYRERCAKEAKELTAEEETLKGKVDELSRKKEAAVLEENSVQGEHDVLLRKVKKLRNTRNEAQGELNKVERKKKKILNEKNKIQGEVNTLDRKRQKIFDEANEMYLEATSALNEVTKIRNTANAIKTNENISSAGLEELMGEFELV